MYANEKVALLITEYFCCWQNDLSYYLIVFSSALDHWIDVAEYDSFLFKVAVGFIDLVTQLLVLPFRKYGLCGSQHCWNTAEAELEVNFSFNSVCVHHLPPCPDVRSLFQQT